MQLSQMTIRGLMIGVMASTLFFAIVRLANRPDEAVLGAQGRSQGRQSLGMKYEQINIQC